MPTNYPRTARGVGWLPRSTTLQWAMLGGITGSVLIGIVMQTLGMLTSGPAALVGSENVVVGWIVHLAAGALFGMPFGAFFRPVNYAAGAIWGSLYGLTVGVLFAWIGMYTLLGLTLVSLAAAVNVILHITWGAIVGGVTAWGMRQTHSRTSYLIR